MIYQVREIGYSSFLQFEADTLDVANDVRVAYIRHDPRQDALIVTCWHEPDIRLENPTDPHTKAKLIKS